MTKSTERLKTPFPNKYNELQDVNQKFIKIGQLIKLSVITQFFPPDYAPTGQLIEELVTHLDKQGVDIEVFTGQPGYAFEKNNAPAVEFSGGVKIKRSRTTQVWSKRIRGKAINGVLFTLRSALYLVLAARDRNTVLLTTAPPFLPVLGYLAHVLFGLSYICVLYDLYPDIAVALDVVPKQHLLTKLWQAVNRRVLRKASGIIVLSPAMEKQVIANYPEVADKISVIHSWANTQKIVPIAKQDNWFAHRHALVNKFTVLYSGNMGRCHDIQTMLEAAKYLQNEPIQFVCIGGGAKREGLVKQVKKIGLKNFLFLPYQQRQDLPYSLTACDLSLVSVDAGMESLVAPSKLYPALATGRPVAVICPKHSYLKQLIADGNCGQTFENGDSYELAEYIRKLSQDSILAQNAGNAAREYAESYFTAEVISKQYYDVLLQAVL
ncbi:glycosyltransferase family 4 protein [Rivularia sp. UHCC 0363]|uniref:glycosyltransferase family 4 protein n=1 Tax=Rivularia sp. UHCC 0363 TaxID=3110244 RepID=UPI002B2090C2|nr:glycosyltransferase family 4 protein [Rivularia sp. UHCC 0363]MEA5596134.1 glycosyltransferase family 4 protein [Rivularia sp. UHCC 0363]